MTELEKQVLHNRITTEKIIEQGLRAEISSLKKRLEHSDIINRKQNLKIEELNKKIQQYEEDLLPIEDYPIIGKKPNTKGFSPEAINYIANAKNSVKIISYVSKELA